MTDAQPDFRLNAAARSMKRAQSITGYVDVPTMASSSQEGYIPPATLVAGLVDKSLSWLGRKMRPVGETIGRGLAQPAAEDMYMLRVADEQSRTRGGPGIDFDKFNAGVRRVQDRVGRFGGNVAQNLPSILPYLHPATASAMMAVNGASNLEQGNYASAMTDTALAFIPGGKSAVGGALRLGAQFGLPGVASRVDEAWHASGQPVQDDAHTGQPQEPASAPTVGHPPSVFSAYAPAAGLGLGALGLTASALASRRRREAWRMRLLAGLGLGALSGLAGYSGYMSRNRKQ